MKNFRVERSRQTSVDLEIVEEFLYETYRNFGDSHVETSQRAEDRVMGILESMSSLSSALHCGTLLSDVYPGLRTLTMDDAVLYFVVDDAASTVKIVGVFFGGQDHQRRMLSRIADKKGWHH